MLIGGHATSILAAKQSLRQLGYPWLQRHPKMQPVCVVSSYLRGLEDFFEPG